MLREVEGLTTTETCKILEVTRTNLGVPALVLEKSQARFDPVAGPVSREVRNEWHKHQAVGNA